MKTITIFEVCADTERINPQTGDYMKVFRFHTRAEAELFAADRTCWGSPATADAREAPMRLARRWGMV